MDIMVLITHFATLATQMEPHNSGVLALFFLSQVCRLWKRACLSPALTTRVLSALPCDRWPSFLSVEYRSSHVMQRPTSEEQIISLVNKSRMLYDALVYYNQRQVFEWLLTYWQPRFCEWDWSVRVPDAFVVATTLTTTVLRADPLGVAFFDGMACRLKLNNQVVSLIPQAAVTVDCNGAHSHFQCEYRFAVAYSAYYAAYNGPLAGPFVSAKLLQRTTWYLQRIVCLGITMEVRQSDLTVQRVEAQQHMESLPAGVGSLLYCCSANQPLVYLSFRAACQR
jgi:hypothetical protein